jgi:pSer/pThr/pTyr-binding forkhead associated (FHA) protein/tetratricopeptide (TPR) repeat protein
LLELVVIDPLGNVRRYPLGFEELIIGRDPQNPIVLDDNRVSRKHARVYHGEKGHYIEDLGSANGVVLEGTLIRGASLLNVGNKIEVGDFVLTIVPEGAAHGALPSAASLKGLSGAFKGQDFPLSGPRITLGRVEGNQIVVEDASVSRHHARLQRERQGWVVHDLGSSNGTFVNDRPITQRELKGGEKITLGSVSFRFTLSGRSRPFTLPAPVVYAMAIGLVAISLAVALALILRPSQALPPVAQREPAAAATNETQEALGLARAALQRRDWDGAIKQFDRVLSRDLTENEAKAGKVQAEEAKVQEQLLRSAEAAAQRGDKVEAVKLLSRISPQSVYADTVQKMSAQLSEAYHNEQKGARGELKLNGEENRVLKAKYVNAKVLAAIERYARGDFDGAVVALTPNGHALDASAAEAAKNIRAVRVKEADGAVAAQQNDTDRAVRAWEDALKADELVVPPPVRSQARVDIKRMMGDGLYRAGYYQYMRGNYAEAFTHWKRGNARSPENLDILAGFRRLEAMEDGVLAETERAFDKDPARSCQRLKEVTQLTLDSAPVHARAVAKLAEKCAGK